MGASGLYYDASGAVGRSVLTNPPNNWIISDNGILTNLINLTFDIISPNTTITLPLSTIGVFYITNWGDNTPQSPGISHTYNPPGIYNVTVDVSGNVTQFGNGSTSWGTSGGTCLLDVTSWSNSLTSLSGAFNGCTNLVSVPSILPASVTNLSYVFQGATHFNQELTWNISNITNLTGALNNCGLSITNYNNLLNTWALQTLIPSLTLGALGLYYDENGASGRSLLTSSPNNWVILDNGPLKYIIGLIFNITASNKVITLPLLTSGILYVNDWGDGTPQSSSITHTYTYPGIYNVKVDASGTLTQFGKGNISWSTTGGAYLTSVTYWSNSLTSLSGAFNNCDNLVSVPSTLPTSVINLSYMFVFTAQFNQDISTWNTSNITNTRFMFQSAIQFNQNLSTWNIGNIIDAISMLNNCALSTINYSKLLNGWAAQTVQSGVTLGATGLTYDASGAVGRSVLTSSPKNWIISDNGLSSLTNRINLSFNIDTSNTSITLPLPPPSGSLVYNNDWGDGTLTNLISHTYINLGIYNVNIYTTTGTINRFGNGSTAWDTSGGVYLTNVTYWDSSFTSFSGAFNGCNHLLSVPSTLPVNVTNVSYMFQGASLFNQNLSTWNIGNITDASGMLNNCALSITNYNNLLNGWSAQTVKPGVVLGAVGLTYDASGAVGRSVLTSSPNNWTIFDNGVICFLKGSKILCNTGYIPIEELKQGMLVKTLLNGYVPIHTLHKDTIYNPGIFTRTENSLYLLSKMMYPDLFENLVITGGHSILVDTLTETEKRVIVNSLDAIYITDDKYRLPAFLDERAVNYRHGGVFEIYHITLENENEFYNYGIWANGLLVESCPINISPGRNKKAILK